MTLEEKVLNFIRAHEKGTKVADIEIPLKESRMRIGFICKKLLDDGKVMKIDDHYFPAPLK